MEAIYTAKAVVSGGRDGVARTEDGQLELKLARPQAMGGSGRRYQSRGTIRSGLCRVLYRRVESGCSASQTKIAGELAHRERSWFGQSRRGLWYQCRFGRVFGRDGAILGAAVGGSGASSVPVFQCDARQY